MLHSVARWKVWPVPVAFANHPPNPSGRHASWRIEETAAGVATARKAFPLREAAMSRDGVAQPAVLEGAAGAAAGL